MGYNKNSSLPELADLPSSPDPEWEPKLLLNKVGERRGENDPRAWSWFLLDGKGTRMMYLSSKGDRAMWNKTPVRSVKEGAARNVAILERAKALLNPDEPMTLRHLFYMLVTDGLISNCEADYKILSGIITDARKDDAVHDDAITDGHRTVERYSGYDNTAEFAADVPYWYTKNRWTSQDSYVELWFEKAAIMSTVERLRGQYQVTLRPFKGQASRTYCYKIAEDFAKVKKPITVYYCGDHDPSGYAIPRSGEQRVREILQEKFDGANDDFTFKRLGFSPDHFEEHNLESWDADLKRSDSSYKWFIERFPDGRCAEIDAIPPDELRTMLSTAIESHIVDRDTWEAVENEEKYDRRMIEAVLSVL